MTGRRKDPIWQHVKTVSAKSGSKTNTRAKSKKIVPLTTRLRKHINLCHKNSHPGQHVLHVLSSDESDSEP